MIRSALDRIAALPGVRVVATSSLHETEPVGGPREQGRYLNGAAGLSLRAEPVPRAEPAQRADTAPGADAARHDEPAQSTTRSARWLLQRLLEIERSLGRVRAPDERNAPRTIDLDLLLVQSINNAPSIRREAGALDSRSAAARDGTLGATPEGVPLIMREADLELPHPRMHERRFVLAPLAEIAPHLRHPITGQTVAAMLAHLPASVR